MFDELERLYQAASAALAESKDSAALEAWESAYLGRKGAVTLALRAVGNLPKADRAAYGKRANEIRRRPRASLRSARRTGAPTRVSPPT